MQEPWEAALWQRKRGGGSESSKGLDIPQHTQFSENSKETFGDGNCAYVPVGRQTVNTWTLV